MTKGTIKYVPKEVVEELDFLKKWWHLDKESEVFKRMVDDSRIGRQIKSTLGFERRK